MKILLAVDGSKAALAATESLIRHAGWFAEPPHVELVTVHLPVPKLPGMSVVIGKKKLHQYYQEEGEACLKPSARKLAAAGIPYSARTLVGDIATRIHTHALATGCELICIGPRGLGNLGKALLGSTATKVLNLSKLPVLLAK